MIKHSEKAKPSQVVPGYSNNQRIVLSSVFPDKKASAALREAKPVYGSSARHHQKPVLGEA